jgi:ABC-2 type transport system permease protein
MSLPAAIPVPGRAWRKLTLTELKLLLRTPAALFWGVGFPLAGWIVIGLIPGTGKPVKALGGASVQETYLPIVITFAVVMLGVQFLPATLVSYRERGILRRMFTTPVTPQNLLTAQIVLILGAQIATTALIAILATGAFSASIGQPLAFILAFLLMAAAASTLGLLVAAVSFTSKAAAAVGAVLFFVLLFFSGLWLPRAETPPRREPVSRPSRTPSPATGPLACTSASWLRG